MKHPVAWLFSILLCVAFTAVAADESLPEILKQVKEEFASGSFEKSLADVDRLETLSARPGFEKDRAQLLPIIAFFRGANYASLRKTAEAQAAFLAYLGYAPNAVLDPTRYSKVVIEAFSKAKAGAAKPQSSIAAAYAAFRPAAGATIASDFVWALSPVRFLFADNDKKRWAALQSNDERTAFVEEFWKRFDPTPDTPVNEFRTEFERRLLFADTMFGTEEESGRQTDRATILTFIGVPTKIGIAPLSTTEGDFMNGGRVSGASLMAEVDFRSGKRETWRYEKEKVPESLRRQTMQADFHFITNDYGKAKLQKDSVPLRILAVAVENAAQKKALP